MDIKQPPIDIGEMLGEYKHTLESLKPALESISQACKGIQEAERHLVDNGYREKHIPSIQEQRRGLTALHRRVSTDIQSTECIIEFVKLLQKMHHMEIDGEFAGDIFDTIFNQHLKNSSDEPQTDDNSDLTLPA